MNKIGTIIFGSQGEMGDIIIILGKYHWIQFYKNEIINFKKNQKFYLKNDDVIIK